MKRNCYRYHEAELLPVRWYCAGTRPSKVGNYYELTCSLPTGTGTGTGNRQPNLTLSSLGWLVGWLVSQQVTGKALASRGRVDFLVQGWKRLSWNDCASGGDVVMHMPHPSRESQGHEEFSSRRPYPSRCSYSRPPPPLSGHSSPSSSPPPHPCCAP